MRSQMPGVYNGIRLYDIMFSMCDDFNKMDHGPIGSYIWMLRHQEVELFVRIRGLGGVAFLKEVCLWE